IGTEGIAAVLDLQERAGSAPESRRRHFGKRSLFKKGFIVDDRGCRFVFPVGGIPALGIMIPGINNIDVKEDYDRLTEKSESQEQNQQQDTP
ncbi:MAG: hypothetical protein R6U19_09270, partial [Bacteroidales bacterium]